MVGVAEGWSVTVDWHVYADGRWMVEPVTVGSAAPVSVWVAEWRMAPVVYRHQASGCGGGCVLVCGHTLSYGCDCDTIAAEAAGQTGSADEVIMVTRAGREHVLDPEFADVIVAECAADSRFTVDRVWESAAYTVAVRDASARVGDRPKLSFLMPLV